MANLDDQTFTKENCLPFDELDALNQYILIRLNDVVQSCEKAYVEYRFADIVQTLSNLMTNGIECLLSGLHKGYFIHRKY